MAAAGLRGDALGLPVHELAQRLGALVGLPRRQDERRPVLVRGGASDLDAVRRWGLEYLNARIGEASVLVGEYGQDRADYTKVTRRDMRFAEFAERRGTVSP